MGPLGWSTACACALPALFLGTAIAGPPRRAILDRHGHLLAHAPPLSRDASCAPSLYGAVLRAGLAGEGSIATRIDGGLQLVAQLAVRRGVERLARLPPSHKISPVAAVPAPGQRLVGTVRAVAPGEIELDLGAPGLSGRLPLPEIGCAGHEQGPESPPAPFRRGERLSLRVVELLPATAPGEPRRVLVALSPQAALVALDPRSRDVVALIGGHGQRPGDFDRALQGRRQAGSTWKPLVYAAALSSRRFRPSDIVEDLPRLYGDWQPKNYSGTYRGSMPLREALFHSINTVAVRLLKEVGAGAVVELAERLGIPAEKVPRDLTQALGTALVSPLQLAGAYAVFADTLGGRYLPPRLFGEDENSEFQLTPPPAIPPAVAYLMTDLLRGVISEGSGQRAKELQIPGLAGKTGTTSLGNDAWFVGYHSDLLAVVWVGDDLSDGTENGRTGADTALPLWIDFMRGAKAVLGRSPPPLPRPPGLVSAPPPEGQNAALQLADTP